MKKIDFLYVAGMHSDQHVPALSKYLTNAKKSYLVVTENYADYVKWKQGDIPVYFLSAGGKAQETSLSNDITRKVGLENIIETEFRYYSLPRRLLEKKFLRLCSSVEKLLKLYEVDVVIQKPGGEILRRIFFNIESVKTVCFGESYFSGYSTVYANEYKAPYLTRSREMVEDAHFLLNKRLGGGKEVKYVAKLMDLPQHKLRRFSLLLRRDCYTVLFSYFSHRLKLWPFGALRSRLSSFLFSRSADELHAKGKRVYYFPLNVKAESELYVRNFMLAEQASLCCKLNDMLPDDSILVVKEHPGNSKSLSLFELFKLWRRGVFIVDSKASSAALLDCCEGVLAVSSTVLIEAINTKKPLLVLGSWPYSRCLLERESENSSFQINDFFREPQAYLVDSEYFCNEAKKYLHKGSAYSDSSDFNDLLGSIVSISEVGVNDT